MKIVRNFYNDISSLFFKPINYTLYNIIDEDCFISRIEKLDEMKYSIDDFVYAEFTLSEKEKFLINMWNREYMENVKRLEKDLENEPHSTVYVNHEWGNVIIIKLKSVKINNEAM